MKKIILGSLILASIAVIGGCAMDARATIEVDISREPAPPEAGAHSDNVIKSHAKIKLEACYPKCSKSDFNNTFSNFNVDLEQSDTYSVPLDGKIHMQLNSGSGQVVAQKAFDIITVGNQSRLVNPAAVADWAYPNFQNGATIFAEIYWQTSGFTGSEYINMRVRDQQAVLAANGIYVEIDCGPEIPSGSPEQACELR
ncbi:hypothetical protein EOE67_07735 [Rheinheimera riviphila]|uniref:Lipoprotein n=1 Tax=Rheinheimera riviphila TaxID=1834037 RepID=A0A437R080_9GAMM|nr:hypothetical protein [Rheinheimera riviphila]RVU40131.1 hypothetical protein EOE67_07735 [Rheinheimera riviphila]